MEKALTIYKASAGSGKTFTLASEYITLVVKNPQDYSRILAVTFTNKATQEMKMRILTQLYGIAHSLKKSQPYFEQVQTKTDLPEITIRENAAEALSLLTHHYNYFRVLTIDAFFQAILRNLARELNLTANLRIDLNDTQVEAQAVDNLVNDLEEGKDLLIWISDYIDRNIEDNQGWNVIDQIKDFGKNIFQDFYKENKDALDKCFNNEGFFDNFIKDLRKRRNTIANKLTSMAKELISVISKANLDNPALFNRGTKGIYNYINKLTQNKPTGDLAPQYVQTCIENADKWPAGKCPKEIKTIIIDLASKSLCNNLKLLEEYRLNNWKEYQSCNLTLRHLSQLRLLHSISEAVDELNKDMNRFMLSNTQSLLSNLMKDSDTPFVFEKIGAYLKHIMIDEFQDTSTIQWNNFKKLLINCMSQGDSHNLIVGDVKQSIYRWRQGDWRLLNNIEKEFSTEQLAIKPLNTNYRSEENIILFNNAFFTLAIEQSIKELQQDNIGNFEQLTEAYKEIIQQPKKSNHKGYVSVKLFPSDNYEEDVLNELTNNVQQLLDLGYRQKSITILVRTKGVIQDIVDTFQHHFGSAISIVSDEAFRLDASLAVNVIILALRLLVHPDDKLTASKLLKLYHQQVLKDSTNSNEILVHPGDNIFENLPSSYIEQFKQLPNLSLIDLVDQLYEMFGLKELEGQSAYVCAFYDTLNEYLRDNPADIDDFIEEWEKSLSQNTIQSDEVDGIRIITIHKSKGLEFDNVLIPFCDWELEKTTGNTIWCNGKDKEDPFNQLPLIPIDFSKKSMMGTIFEDDYKEEHLQNIVDNMNLLYVAFTRASKNLFISGKRMKDKKLKELESDPTNSNRSQIIQLITESLSSKLDGATLCDGKESEPLEFEFGTLCKDTDNSTKLVDNQLLNKNPFSETIESKLIKIETFPHPAEFRQSNKSEDFIKGEDVDPSDANRYIKVGNILHQLFSTILTEEDIEPRLKDLEQQGVVYNDEVTSTELRNKIANALRNEKVKSWFSDRWELFNECTIIEYDNQEGVVREHRPDRVMTDGNEIIIVDFKFGKPRTEYHEQVKQYIELLKRMGHKDISGYLWYVMRNEVEEVNITQ